MQEVYFGKLSQGTGQGEGEVLKTEAGKRGKATEEAGGLLVWSYCSQLRLTLQEASEELVEASLE